MENKKILFVDMDGVLANFDKGIGNDLNKMFEPGFFFTLEPMEQDLNETIQEIQKQGYTVKILSKACVAKEDKRFKGQVMDKVKWINKYIPCIDELNIIITDTHTSKGDIVEMYKHHECILIDDYSKNLAEWSFAGGKGIKKAKRIRNSRPWKQVLNISELAIEGVE